MRKITEAIIHCSGSTWGSALAVDDWHKKRGWDGCGYHFIILNGSMRPGEYLKSLDGQIEAGRPLEIPGAHCRGHNTKSIGLCLIGNNKFTDAQFRSLVILLSELKVKFPGILFYPHNEYNIQKTCPNFDVKRVLNYDF